CPYLRACLGAALDGAYGPLAGVIVANGCDGLRRLADVWARYGPGFVHLLDVPRRRDEAALAYLTSQFTALAERLALVARRALTEHALRLAIAERNATRRLLGELDARRQGQALPVRELLSLVDLSAEAPPAVCNLSSFSAPSNPAAPPLRSGLGWEPPLPGAESGLRLAEQLACPPAATPAAGTPVVLSGNVFTPDDRPLAGLIEAAGGWVVGDDLCSGVRGLAGEVTEEGDPMQALARRYLERVPCPRMADAAARWDDLADLCGRREARGVIHLSQEYCDASLYELAPLHARLERAGVRLLHLELDADAATPGQARTRVEAFLEGL
ncbi:MAG TPA: 2-hydroxyacyl-CoA dehydratase family protein, partial [Anaerolineae bacterium]|nr:2-hydroxyacyl-CoA dehydratase family protein [Anaerolineae bacterium]